MSRDVKYVGMDVHKEAVVIAVLNGSGKLVMESIVETQSQGSGGSSNESVQNIQLFSPSETDY